MRMESVGEAPTSTDEADGGASLTFATSLHHSPESVHLTEVARLAHHFPAVGVVAERRVAFDRLELAAAEVLLDDADVVGDPAVPVEDRDVARQGSRPPLPHA